MSEAKTIKVRILRSTAGPKDEPSYETYEVPFVPGMSVMNAMDYIYQHLDGTVAYHDHAGCALGICAKCTCKINEKTGLLCQTSVGGDVTVEPLNRDRVLRDLVGSKRS